jgi:hypothetical protein
MWISNHTYQFLKNGSLYKNLLNAVKYRSHWNLVFCWVNIQTYPDTQAPMWKKLQEKTSYCWSEKQRHLTDSYICSSGKIKSSLELGTWLHDIKHYKDNQRSSDSSDNHFSWNDKLFARMLKLYWWTFHFNKYNRIFNNIPIQTPFRVWIKLLWKKVHNTAYLITILLLYLLSINFCLIKIHASYLNALSPKYKFRAASLLVCQSAQGH